MGLMDELKSVFVSDSAAAEQAAPSPTTTAASPSAQPATAGQVIPPAAPNTPIIIGERGQWPTSTGRIVEARAYKIPRRFENRHFLITGTTGSGKSTLFYQMFDQIRDREDKALIVDHGGENITRYYRPGDIILNPFDQRFPGWNPYNEIRTEFDHDNLSRFVIPDAHGESKAWSGYAQSIYAAVSRACEARGDTAVKSLLYYLMRAEPATLLEMLGDEPAAALFSKGSEKMGANARSIIGASMTAWRYLDEGPFSLRDWIEDDNDRRWVFLSYKESTFAAMRSFISMAVSIAINYGLDLPTDPNRRIWFSLDEFGTLPAMKVVSDALQKIRKKGGCVVAGMQSASQAVEEYGKEGATTLFANFNTYIALRPGDAETAELFSKHFGEQQVWRNDYSDNSGIGGGGHNSGESVSTKLHQQRVATYTELMLQDDLTAVIKLPGSLPVGHLKIPYVDRPKVAEPFIPRSKN